MNYQIPKLPFADDVETKAVLKQAAKAHRRLAELKGVALTIPNEQILISTLTLQEAKDSSAIENIITTHDEIFKAELYIENLRSPAAKEVQSYANALRKGFGLVRKNKILTNSFILQIQEELEQNKAGFRKLPGTALKNQQTGETVYMPPQDPEEILGFMQNLEAFINDDDMSDLDPLIKLAIIHHQFESIHPFYDGNGRTGRIINILYLVTKDLLDLPVLYLSRFVIENKGEYYRLLQAVRDNNEWEDWVLFMLRGIEQTALQTISLIENIKILMMDYKKRIRSQFPKIYSQELLNSLFSHPYTKIEFVEESLGITRKTASSYLKTLVKANYLELIKIGRSNFYLNKPLYELFLNVPELYKTNTPIIESGNI
jgi:Fic family protein